MKNKSYLKTHRKKSLASLFLAVLLMFTFNSSPIILLSDSLKTSNAYKSSETQTYYSTSESTEEKNFSDANFPSSLSEHFEGSEKNFNIYKKYIELYNEIYQEKVDDLFVKFGESNSEYNNSYENFLKHFGAESLSELYTKEKDGSFIKLNLESNTFQCLAETLGADGFSDYDLSSESTLSISPITSYIDKYARKSDFYRMLADYAINGTLDNGTEPDDADHPNNSLTTDEAFYKSNTHYLRLKEYIDNEVAKKFPIHTFDGTTQDANIASIMANGAPTSVEYNYVANSYDRYSAPSATYVTNTIDGATKNTIYYFGDLSDLSSYDMYQNNIGYFAKNITAESKETADIFYYKLITSGYGYIDSTHPTYFKYSGTNTPYIKTNSSLTTVYVLNDNPSQAELDTYASIYFTHITSDNLTNESGFYVNIPLESDEIYFKSVYNNLLHSKKAFDYETFKNYFTSNGTSKLYFKLGSSEYRHVYIDIKEYNYFKADYPDYKFLDSLKTFDTDASGYTTKDYEIIVSGSSNASYLPKTEDGKTEYKLYFAKEKSYYTEPADSSYGEYEQSYKPVVNLEQQNVASLAYEMDTNDSSKRKIYVLDEAQTTITLDSVDYECIKQSDIDSNPNFYVEVPTSLYPNNIESDTYKLYYKHTSVSVDKIYIVDNADNALENKIYQTLNYNVIKSIDLEDNYSNYLIISEDDANYNKNFQLYYKYDREPVETTIYVLKEELATDTATDGNSYVAIGSGELSDYVLIDKTEKPNEYTTAKDTLAFLDEDDFHLYYKLSNVFVQNELKGANAIYVIDTSLKAEEKEDYTQNGYTPISQKDIDNNPGLYVALTEKDPNWRNQKDLKLYYKYIQSTTATKTVYSYDSIDTSSSDFDKNAYELIESGEDGYVEGKDSYYKKVLVTTNTNNISKPTFYYYQTSKTVSLTANSYYVISFYVQTIGDDARASFYIKDTSNIISDIKLDNITTNGEWEQYYVYISTDVNTASTVHLYLYLGDEVNGIKGNTSATKLTGSVFFDDIKITKIGLTDYNKLAIDEQPVYSTLLTTGEGEDKQEVEGAYADKYNNRIYIANLESVKDSDARFTSNVYEYKNYLDASTDPLNTFASNWNSMFQFDTASDDLKNLLGYDSNVEGSTKIANTLSTTINDDMDGYNMYDSSFNTLWRYYISRDLANEFSIEKYRQAYTNGKLDVSITNKIEEPEEKDDNEEESDTNEDSDDKVYISTPFNAQNYALKLDNTHKDISLGITSNSFTVKQFEYYKISMWIYSPDLEGKATISVNSVMKTRQSPTYGTLLSSSISSTVANIESSSSKSSEYGWIPVTLFIEGNNYQDMECYLVLSADAESTVYFDNIRIEKTTSAKYDDAQSSSSSNKYTCALSLIPSTSINSTDIKNGTFDYIKETSFDHDVTSDVPYTPDSWTTMSTNSKRVVAGVVSTQQEAFFKKYSNGVVPTEGSDTYSNVYAIYAPSTVSSLHNVNDEDDIEGYRHNFSIYSGSLSLSANAIYQISFKFYKGANFDGKLMSNIYLSAVKDQNIVTSLVVDNTDMSDGWQTYTYYLETSSSTSTAYIEIGVEDAQGISFIKSVTSKKLSGKTIAGLVADIAKENNIDSSTTTDIFKALNNIRFFSLSNLSFNYYTPDINEETNLHDQKTLADKTELSDKYTIGQNGIAVAKYFDTVYTTTYSVTINKVTYYIGEVYTANINDTQYFVHKTYNLEKNVFEYTIYSDEDLTNKVSTINNETATVDTSDGVKVKVSETSYDTTTSYRLFRFSDLTEEVRVLDGSTITVPSLDKVIVGTGTNETENTATSTQNISYEYHFNSSTQSDYVINNTIIPAEELDNAQSANVLILSNSYSTDYITLSQTNKNTLGKSTYNVLRIYVKTSDFASDDFGLNINISAINTEWTNINTTNLTNKDKYGFVCYEALIKSNSTDSISDIAVELSLGGEENTGAGYAIISSISITALSSASEFEHYSSMVDDDDEFTKKAIFDEKSSSSSSSDKDEDEADDENSVSWATFFYIFSSLLLVITMVVAMIAIIMKKHPIKLAQKYSNEHERDIETVKTKKTTNKSKKDDVVIGEIEPEVKKPKKNDGGIE